MWCLFENESQIKPKSLHVHVHYLKVQSSRFYKSPSRYGNDTPGPRYFHQWPWCDSPVFGMQLLEVYHSSLLQEHLHSCTLVVFLQKKSTTVHWCTKGHVSSRILTLSFHQKMIDLNHLKVGNYPKAQVHKKRRKR